MLTLKDILTVCSPTWIDVGQKSIYALKRGVPEELLGLPVANITGFDDGVTIELETEEEA